MALAAGLLAALASDASAQAKNPFVGRWTQGDAASCAPGSASDEVSIKIAEKRIELVEESCEIRSIRKMSKLPSSGYRLRLACQEASRKHAADMLLTLARQTPFHDELLVRIDLDDGVAFTYRRCPP
jgi:hypothetical protein